MKDKLIAELKLLYDTELSNEIPSEDITKIEEDFHNRITEVEWLIGDFNEFCMLVAGSSSYILSNKKIPNYQRNLLEKNFFSLYPQYLLIKNSKKYPIFFNELSKFERARELLLEISSS